MGCIKYNKTISIKGVIMTRNYNNLPTEEEIAKWEESKGKRPFNGIGNLFRQYSQYLLMQKWENKYHFISALEAPYDHATDGIDGNILKCPHTIAVNADTNSFDLMETLPSKYNDFVWNFGFLQREPSLLLEMIRISSRYVAAFVPNYTNPGTAIHKVYHIIYKGQCNHPERGHRNIMSIHGLWKLFNKAGLVILESGYVDIPPFPDTVVTIKEFFGSKSREVLKIPGDMKKLLPFEERAFPKWLWAHHCYVIGEKTEW
jgi:hypothetical protein